MLLSRDLGFGLNKISFIHMSTISLILVFVEYSINTKFSTKVPTGTVLVSLVLSGMFCPSLGSRILSNMSLNKIELGQQRGFVGLLPD